MNYYWPGVRELVYAVEYAINLKKAISLPLKPPTDLTGNNKKASQ